MKAVSLQSALDTIEQLEVKLTEFAKKHQKEIKTDPVFRQRFLEMCGPIGVDPLASKKGFIASVLGMGDFYHELAVKVAEVCLANRSTNGGIMSVREVQLALAKRKTRLGMTSTTEETSTSAAAGQNNVISSSDIQVAVSKLAKLGGGFRVVQVGPTEMIVSVPQELDNDHMSVMAVAAAAAAAATTTTDSSGGAGITLEEIRQATGWTSERCQRAVDLLLQQGMAWLDVWQGRRYYWFPSIWQETKQQQQQQTQSS